MGTWFRALRVSVPSSVVLAAVIVLGLTACSPEQQAEARERVTVERERLRAGFESGLAKLEEESKALRAKAATASGEARAQWERSLADLEGRKALAREKLRTLGEVSADAWDEVRSGFERAAEELQRANDQARSGAPAPTSPSAKPEPEQRR
ncbi:MAG: hypothetical protein K8S98_12765 [Planctomycetes bacterium]|nr:hypothetical protein [Planctomycetota bacterium]